MSTEVTKLPVADRAVIAFDSSKTEIALKEILIETENVKTVIDAAGREQAHRLGMRLKNARIAIEKTGKSAREDAQAFSKAVIDEEKRLKSIIGTEEDRIFLLRDSFS